MKVTINADRLAKIISDTLEEHLGGSRLGLTNTTTCIGQWKGHQVMLVIESDEGEQIISPDRADRCVTVKP